MNVFSLLEDPVAGTLQNPTCAAKVGIETFQFAFVTKNGSQAPANPIDSTLTTFTPDKQKDLFMNSGDRLQVSIHDTADGVRAQIDDLSNNKSGSMTASPANGFTQIQYDPTGTSCKSTPYAFHPMYSTASEQTRVIWAAHSYNVAFADEIGHFEFCNGARYRRRHSGSTALATRSPARRATPRAVAPTNDRPTVTTTSASRPRSPFWSGCRAAPRRTPASTALRIPRPGRTATPGCTRHRSSSPARSPATSSTSPTAGWRSRPTWGPSRPTPVIGRPVTVAR